MTLNHLEIWGIWGTPFIAIARSSTLAEVVAPYRVLFMDQKEQTMSANKWLMLNFDSHETI